MKQRIMNFILTYNNSGNTINDNSVRFQIHFKFWKVIGIVIARDWLIGKNDNTLGTRFPDMSNCYNKELREIALNCASYINIDLKQH